MLSPATLEFIDALCHTSRAAYSEGGILWTYTEAANRAHSKIQDLQRSGDARPLSYDELGRWLQVPLGDWGRNGLPPIQSGSHLVALLRMDIAPDEISLLIDDQGTSATCRICMVRLPDNRYFELELWWSLD